MLQVDWVNSKCSKRVAILLSSDNIQNVLIMAEIIVAIVLELVVLVILMVKEGILLSFVLRKILVLVKLLHRYKKMLQVLMLILSHLELLHRVLVDKVDKVLRKQVKHQDSLLWLHRTSKHLMQWSQVFGVLHLLVSLGIILAMDKLLKKAFVEAAIKFPSALFGMFCTFTVLMVLDSIVPKTAAGLMNFFEPALLFIQRWLPLFYVPSLVVLPLAVKDIPAASGAKIMFILVGGWLASLCVAGFTAISVRKMVKTEMIPAEPMSKPSPFSSLEMWTWSAIFLASFVGALYYPTALGTSARTCLPFLLSSTVLGYLVGSGLPSAVKKVFHPIICCAVSADLAAIAFGYLSKSGLDPVLGDYLTKAASNPGAGDILMGFLGSVIISFAFSMFKQRKLVKRHAAEIFTSVIISTLFSLYSTALIGRLVGLEPDLTVSILPRCITVALALSIVSLFEGVNSSLTAAVVVLTGLVGANFVQAVLDKLGFNDPIARGIATASSAHGLGTAALSAKEPEALPFCAIAYALTGIFGSLVCSVPAVRQSLLAIVG
ncbi:Plastidal glycolate/glycerate translocator 1, chloroplastic [Capsicum baccatum]|uniref:Plastidal glycolate/glycerate translocator 1, chloroplastic n=1 Tax=Capsicum baccatum TaxID=33114 RepID=A0A2G2XLX5_CAPBA|nr:Plastidal glycolate/glycerate translocator 1, chloroplastic [Capsicum baccatum]